MISSFRTLPTVLIACPVSSRGWILPYYLNHIVNLDYPKHLISIYFIINNSSDNSKEILTNFKNEFNCHYKSITIERFKSGHSPKDVRSKNVRLEYTYKHLSALRNKILKHTCDNDFSYCFSVDSDILLPSNILKKLLSHKKDVISGVIYNGYLVDRSAPWKYPNIMRFNSKGYFEHIANSYVKSSPFLTESKVAQIDGAGAIVLLSKDVCRDTTYGFHEQGEDLYWSLDCDRKGYRIYVDYSAFAYHAMNEELLHKFIKMN